MIPDIFKYLLSELTQFAFEGIDRDYLFIKLGVRYIDLIACGPIGNLAKFNLRV